MASFIIEIRWQTMTSVTCLVGNEAQSLLSNQFFYTKNWWAHLKLSRWKTRAICHKYPMFGKSPIFTLPDHKPQKLPNLLQKCIMKLCTYVVNSHKKFFLTISSDEWEEYQMIKAKLLFVFSPLFFSFRKTNFFPTL